MSLAVMIYVITFKSFVYFIYGYCIYMTCTFNVMIRTYMTQVLAGKVVGFAGKYRLHIYFSFRMHNYGTFIVLSWLLQFTQPSLILYKEHHIYNDAIT